MYPVILQSQRKVWKSVKKIKGSDAFSGNCKTGLFFKYLGQVTLGVSEEASTPPGTPYRPNRLLLYFFFNMIEKWPAKDFTWLQPVFPHVMSCVLAKQSNLMYSFLYIIYIILYVYIFYTYKFFEIQ